MATTHRGPINLDERERLDFRETVKRIDAKIDQLRRDPNQPQPLSFSEEIPSRVTDQTIEAMRVHYKAEWGIQPHRRGKLAAPLADGEDPNGWILLFSSHL